jgi:hypothetical protein
MNLNAKIPAFFLFTIIFAGGFGIVRMIFVDHNLIGLTTIILALVLAWVYMRMAILDRPSVGRIMGTQKSKWPIQLAAAASENLDIFPGRPEGYAGYTDYTAMSVDVNDDLSARQPIEQYTLLGFGNGFLTGVRGRLAAGQGDGRISFRVINASQKDKESIGWLSYLQRSGTDNAGPSTENLHSVVEAISADINSKGPITLKFWDKVHNKQSENLDLSGTTSDKLRGWTNVYQTEFLVGQRRALEATIVPALR